MRADSPRNNFNKMKVLSLFDGIACARVALKKAGHKVEAYYASEVDKYAINIAQRNWHDIIQLGDIKELSIQRSQIMTAGKRNVCLPPIDLLIGGSPCQDLSIAKKNREGLDGKRSNLFWEYVRILKETKPKYFILENVASMHADAKKIITETLGVEPIMIDAALVSAQRRKRLFWTNIPNVTLPKDKGIFLKDIIEDGYTPDDKSLAIQASYGKKNEQNYFRKREGQMIAVNDTVYQYRRTYWRETKGGKVPTLTANMGTGGHNVPFILQTPRGNNKGGKKYGKVPTLSCSKWEHNNKLNGMRKLTTVECERLQCLPDGYTAGVSNTQRYHAIGNAFNVDVVAHILRKIPKK